jgi:1-acyl-sn-glycerol-3-phosphate acyltransferase
MLRDLLRLAWGGYCYALFAVLVAFAILLAMLLPSVRLRRDGSRAMAGLLFRLSGLPIRVTGLDRLPAAPSVVVANHSSYVDGPLLYAALPSRFGFVIKKEAAGVPLGGWLLRRLGHEFVDRHNRAESARDARRILRAAVGGGSVVFFPEGTFTEEPGLARFRSGAFVTAARAGMPVVPVVIHGARHVLRAETWLPRRGPLTVEILEPLARPEPGERDAVSRMRDEARQRILERLGEPDLEGTAEQ